MKEVDLRAPVSRFLEDQGYEVWFDPDGTDYFDAVAVRGEEVGLVELKVADWRRVREQALLRRGWGDWVAVVLPRRSLAERAAGRMGPARAQRVGIWYVEDSQIHVLRESVPFLRPGEVDPFPGLKAHLQELLAGRRSGVLPPPIAWRPMDLPHGVTRRRGALSGKAWKLEEFQEASPSSAPKGEG